MNPFSREMKMFDNTSTKVVANPIDMPLMALVVVANVGQQPNNNTKMGFSLMSPLVKVCILLLIALSSFHSYVHEISLVGLKRLIGLVHRL